MATPTRTTLATGATRGIGLETVRRLATTGVNGSFSHHGETLPW